MAVIELRLRDKNPHYPSDRRLDDSGKPNGLIEEYSYNIQMLQRGIRSIRNQSLNQLNSLQNYGHDACLIEIKCFDNSDNSAIYKGFYYNNVSKLVVRGQLSAKNFYFIFIYIY
jgi:hypothetical protein